MNPKDYLLPFQVAWVKDRAPLKMMEKSRQVGASYVDALDSVIKAGREGARLDVWVSSRDEKQARLYLRDCLNWARLLEKKAEGQDEIVFKRVSDVGASYLEFSSGRRIYSVSSAP